VSEEVRLFECFAVCSEKFIIFVFRGPRGQKSWVQIGSKCILTYFLSLLYFYSFLENEKFI
jgi:hypothetical protein